MQASRFLLATGKVREPQARSWSYPPRTFVFTGNHNPATPRPNSRSNRSRQWTRAKIKGRTSTTGIKGRNQRIGMTEQENRLAREREEIATRVANFKATQEKFQRERGEYFAATLENACNGFNAKAHWS
jgi:hypothetical protein